MTEFEEAYKMCVGAIVKDLRKHELPGEAEEFVNQGYVDLVNSNKDISYINLYKSSLQRAFKKEEFVVERRSEFSRTKTRRVCIRCHEDQPIAFFGITLIGEKRVLQPYCRDCAKKYFKEYVNKDRDAWNAKLKSRYRKEADELHDNYIKKWLRVYGWKTKDITPEVIRYKRREMLAKRVSQN